MVSRGKVRNFKSEELNFESEVWQILFSAHSLFFFDIEEKENDAVEPKKMWL